MPDDLYKNWPVYLGLAGFIIFVIYAIINSRRQEKADKEQQDNKK